MQHVRAGSQSAFSALNFAIAGELMSLLHGSLKTPQTISSAIAIEGPMFALLSRIVGPPSVQENACECTRPPASDKLRLQLKCDLVKQKGLSLIFVFAHNFGASRATMPVGYYLSQLLGLRGCFVQKRQGGPPQQCLRTWKHVGMAGGTPWALR